MTDGSNFVTIRDIDVPFWRDRLDPGEMGDRRDPGDGLHPAIGEGTRELLDAGAEAVGVAE